MSYFKLRHYRLREQLEAVTGEGVLSSEGIGPASERKSVRLAGIRDAAMERPDEATREGDRTEVPMERHVEIEVEL